jgi:hypothetical protein
VTKSDENPDTFSDVQAEPSQTESPPVPLVDGSIKCSIVTQYGSTVRSCSGQIFADEPVTKRGTEPSISGKWRIVEGNLNIFPELNFKGQGDFQEDGKYKITTNPLEFDQSEGEIIYTGRYLLEGSVIQGKGKSTIYQKGAVFGQQASDTLTGNIDSNGKRIVGRINSISGFHEGGGEGNATFSFTLEKVR